MKRATRVRIVAMIAIACGLHFMIAHGAGAQGSSSGSNESGSQISISALDGRLGELESRVEDLDPLSSGMATLVTFALLLGALTSWFFGRKEITKYALAQAETVVNQRITEHLSRVDPSRVPVYIFQSIFADLGADAQRRRTALFEMLQRMGFVCVPFESFDTLGVIDGCVVYRFTPEEGNSRPHTSPDEAAFVRYLHGIPLERSSATGFVVFAPYPVRGSEAVDSAFPTITYANSIATIGTNVLTIARSISPHFAQRT